MGYCVGFRPFKSGKLRGYADIQVSSGHIYHGCPVFVTDDGINVGLPRAPMMKDGRLVTTEDGKPIYVPVVSITDPDELARFVNMAVHEVYAFLNETPTTKLEDLILGDCFGRFSDDGDIL